MYGREEDSEPYVAELEQVLRRELNLETCDRLGSVKGGIINKAAAYNTDAGEIFVKYAPRENVSEP